MSEENCLVCRGCSERITDRYFLVCKFCNLTYDLDCANVSEERFRNTMNAEHKANYECDECRSRRPKKGNTDTPVGSKPNNRPSEFCPELQESLIDLTDYGCQADTSEILLPCSGNDNITVRRQQPFIDRKMLNFDDTFEDNINQHSLRSVIREELERIFDDRLLKFFKKYDEEMTVLNEKTKLNITKLNDRVKSLENKITLIEKNIERMVIESRQRNVSDDTSATASPVKKLTPLDKKSMSSLNKPEDFDVELIKECKNTATKTNNETISEEFLYQHNKNDKTKNKICIISSSKDNRILSIAEKRLGQYHRLCHFLKPNCGAQSLFQGLEDKLKDFDLKDYCIIIIGHDDFNRTNDYLNLVLYIRDVIQRMYHTNIIICLPTFKYGHNFTMFTSRLESFNRLLYLDINALSYAYLLDSNRNLRYDYTHFSRSSGIINDNGMDIIFRDIAKLIDAVHKKHSYQSVNSQDLIINDDLSESLATPNISSNNQSSDFFRV